MLGTRRHGRKKGIKVSSILDIDSRVRTRQGSPATPPAKRKFSVREFLRLPIVMVDSISGRNALEVALPSIREKGCDSGCGSGRMAGMKVDVEPITPSLQDPDQTHIQFFWLRSDRPNARCIAHLIPTRFTIPVHPPFFNSAP